MSVEPHVLYTGKFHRDSGEVCTLFVSQAHGAGSTYGINLNGYHVGTITHFSDGWTPMLNSPLFTGDELSALLDLIPYDHPKLQPRYVGVYGMKKPPFV